MTKPVFVRPYSKADVETGGVRANGIISVRPSAVIVEPRWNRDWFNGRIFAQWFDDHGEGEWLDALGQKRHGPDRDHLEGVLFFARWTAQRALTDTVHIAVQCETGLTIAPALCAVLLADLLGPGQEAEVAARLAAMDQTVRFAPNLAVLALGDQALARQGRLIAAVGEAFPSLASAA